MSTGTHPSGVPLDAETGTALDDAGASHQRAGAGVPALTTQQGVPVADDQTSLTLGRGGPTLLEDFHLREKLFHFDHERIPERVVHARGFGAHGFFENYAPLTELTRADLFQREGERTPAFVRFSTVAGNEGSADLVRDVRGFAVKLYTRQGNWDLVGNNIPVFFIQDAMKFPDLVHAVKQEPDRGFPQAATAHDNFWDFISLTPESMHMVMWIMSDRTIPRSLRFMEGFGVHTFRLLNDAGEERFVKFHWKPLQGLQSVVWNEAVKINGADPDYHRRDLWNAIHAGDFPVWELGLQVFDQAFADAFPFDPLDATKLIPEELVPVRRVGRLVLNRCVDNFFAETEQVAFCTQNVVPGIDFSNDPLLQGRNFSYLDTQLKRLGGPNFTHIPVNAPRCPMHHFQQDGHMALPDRNPRGRANYEPNSWGAVGGPREDPAFGFVSHTAPETGTRGRLRPERFADHYSQARQFYLSQQPTERLHMARALTFELGKVETAAIQTRMVAHLLNIDEQLAMEVADGLGMTALPSPARTLRPIRVDLPPSSALSILSNGPASFAGRKVGVVVGSGSDAKLLAAVCTSLQQERASWELVARTTHGTFDEQGESLGSGQAIRGAPSVLYDAVVLLLAEAGVRELIELPETRDFVADAYVHCKRIGYTRAARKLFEQAGLDDAPDDGCVMLEEPNDVERFLAQCRAGRHWARETPPSMTTHTNQVENEP